MNAQKIIDTCNQYAYNRKKVRHELNIAWLINDTVKEFKKYGNRNIKRGV